MSEILYSEFKEALDFAFKIPRDDLRIILEKPPVLDRGADHRWRMLCEKYGVDTSPEGKSGNVKEYYRVRRRDQKILRLEQEIRELKNQLEKKNKESAWDIARKLRG